jgi:hypothetical protein
MVGNTVLLAAIWLSLFGIGRELRMIRKRMGGTVHFLPWKED